MPKKIEIDIAVSTDVKSVEQLTQEIKQMSKARDQATDPKKIQAYNKELEKLTAQTKDSKKAIKGQGEALKGVGTDGAKGLKGVATGFKGVGLAIKAAGIGLVIAAFAALKTILEKNQPFLDFIDTAFTAIGLVVTKVSDSFSSAGTEFSALTTIGKNLLTLVLSPIKVIFYTIKAAVIGAQLAWEDSFLGGGDEKKIAELKESLIEVGDDLVELKDNVVDAAISIKDNLGEAIGEIGTAATAVGDAIGDLDAAAILSAAKRTTALKNAALIAEAVNKGRFEAFDREAELLRQIRDDTSKSVEDRIEANNKLKGVLEEQEVVQLRLANVGVQAARAALAGNNTIENRVALINAQNEVEGIQAAIAGKRSEQIVNEVGLEKELLEINQAAIDRTAERGIAQREFDAEQKKNDEERIALKKENLEIEIDEETQRLQRIIDNANAGTQAKVDAEQTLFDKEEEFRQMRKEIEIEEDELALEESELAIEKALIDAENEEIKFNERRALLSDRAALIANDTNLSEKQKTAFLKENTAARKTLDKEEVASKQAQATAISATLTTAAGLLGKHTKAGKVAAIAAATIDTIKGGIAAFNGMVSTIPGPVGIAAGAVAAVGVVASGVASIKKIAAVKAPGAPPVSTPSIATPSFAATPSTNSNSSASAPSLSTDTIFASSDVEGQETETVGSGAGINQRAYVVESDITTAQSNVSGYQTSSEIG